MPKPEKDVANAAKRKRAKPRSVTRKKSPKDNKGGGGSGGGVKTVPKVPLVRA
jgi:ATP-dependent Clp protease ATP-binding subunit ClpA